MHRLGYVDGLRAVAVLMVVFLHAFTWIPNSYPYPIYAILNFGGHGVDLFFVVSGFCLSYPFLLQVNKNDGYSFNPPRYAAKRLVRIVPPYYAAIAAILVANKLALVDSKAGAEPLNVFKQLLFIDGHANYLSPAFWTLPIEFRWYFLFPFALWLYAAWPRLFALVVIACPILFYTLPSVPIDLGTISTFMLGIWLADLEIRQSAIRRTLAACAAPLLIIAVAVDPRLPTPAFPGVPPHIGVAPLAAGALFAFAAAAGTFKPLRDLLALAPVRFIGVASYSIYLIHLPAIAFFEHHTHLGPLAAAVASVLVSIAFWWAIERPIMATVRHEVLVSELTKPVAGLWKRLKLPARLAVQAKSRPATPDHAA